MTKIMNNNKVYIISFLICHIYSVNVNDERRKVMNLELIKNNIIIRLITKKEFDRLTKQLEATKDEFPYRKWNDLYLIYRSIIPYIKYNNLTDGNETSYSMSMAAYFGNLEQMSATFSSSEGENIALSLGRIAEKIGRKIKECEEDHKTQLFIFMDGIDSGLSIDAIEDVKKYLFDTIFQRAKDLDVYLIVSANGLYVNDQ